VAIVDAAHYRAMSRRAAQTARRVRLALWFEEVKESLVRRIDRACWWLIGGAVVCLAAQIVRGWAGW